MNLDKMVAEAKERLHRSIGQRARWARHDFLRDIRAPRQKDWVSHREVIWRRTA